MARVGSRDTAPELLVRRLLWRMDYRYRLHRAGLPGKPDIVFPSRRKAVLVHGCFWHGHDCKRGARAPRANADYWERKIGGNRDRDARNQAALTELGWRALVLWECELGDEPALMHRLRDFLDPDPG